MIIKFEKLFLVTFLAGVFCVAKAQKLPNIQEASLRAPATIKIDGKPTEWNNQFQAYNKATEIFYTLSNDKDKLYLAVQVTDLDIINKIVSAGLTLTINGSGKMKNEGGTAVTFPTLNETDFPHNAKGVIVGPAVDFDNPQKLAADAFTVVLNKKFADMFKDIRLKKGDESKGHLISIYNPEGIKAAALIDEKNGFTYELSIPLKYLGLSAGSKTPLVYNVKLSGINPDLSDILDTEFKKISTLRNKTTMSNITGIRVVDGVASPMGPNVFKLTHLLSPTDFTGEYTLAK